MAANTGIEFNLVKVFGTISSRNGWDRDVSIVGWNGRNPKIDIRTWSEEHTKLSKGANFTKEEAMRLRDILNAIDFDTLDLD